MEIHLKINEEKINKGFVDLNRASKLAVKNTLNIIAAISRRNYQSNIRRSMILRNKFTENSIRYDKAEGDNIALMESRVGALKRADYLLLHEESGRRKPKRGSKLAIPQDYSRGGSHRRPVSKSLYLRKLKSKKIKGKFKKRFRSRKARGVARAYVAYREKKIIKYSENLYLITSFTKNKTRIKYKKRHIYNVSERSAHIKQRKMLSPAIEQPIRDAQNIYNSQMKKLLRSTEII